MTPEQEPVTPEALAAGWEDEARAVRSPLTADLELEGAQVRRVLAGQVRERLAPAWDELTAENTRLTADLDYARRGALAAIEKRDEAREERRNAEDERDRLRARLTGISIIFRGSVLTEELERAPGDATTEELRAVADILWGQADAPEAKP